jgi:zinc protease
VDSLREVALSVLRRFAQDGPTADEVARVRESMLRDRETALRENEFWMDLLQSEALWGDDPVEIFSAYAARVRALDARGIQTLARIVFDETNIARFTLMPENSRRTP